MTLLLSSHLIAQPIDRDKDTDKIQPSLELLEYLGLMVEGDKDVGLVGPEFFEGETENDAGIKNSKDQPVIDANGTSEKEAPYDNQ